MLKRCLSVAVALLMIGTYGVRLVNAESSEEKQARFTQKVKEGVAKLGHGPDARVKIKLRDKTELKGYIRESDEEHFVILDPNSGTATKVAFSDVTQVKGNNLSKGAKVAITLVAVGVIAILLLIAAPRT